MNTVAVQDALEQLGGNLKDIEENLQPLLTPPSAFSKTAQSMPALERAKLYATVVYALESLLFSYLKLQGINVQEHKVMKEITRMKQYFDKIKEAEKHPAKPDDSNNHNPTASTMSLNKQAANRMIKHALAGNQKFDLELAERKAKELLVAKKKLQELEDRKRQRDLHAASSGPATPAAPGSNAQSPEVDASMVANAVAQISVDAETAAAAIAAAEADTQTPDSPTPSEASTKSARKGKKRRHRDRQQADDSPGGKKKRKHNAGSGPDGGDAVDS